MYCHKLTFGDLSCSLQCCHNKYFDPYLYNFFSSLVLRWTCSSSYLVMECKFASSLFRLDSVVSKQGMSMACRMFPIPSASFLEPSLAALLAFSRLDVTRSGH